MLKSLLQTTTTTTTAVATRRPLFRVGPHRRRNTTTPKPSSGTTNRRVTISSTSSAVTKIVGRKPSSVTGGTKPVESQVPTTTTARPPTTKISSRFKFISRKAPTRLTSTTTPPPKKTNGTLDQTLESSNQQSREETTKLADVALALQSIQKAPKPTKRRPQRVSATRVTSKSTTRIFPITETPPIILKKHTVPLSTRSRFIYSTTVSPLAVITSPKIVTTRRKPVQAFEKIISPIESNTDYDYYDDIGASVLARIPEHSKVLLHSNGIIECLDQGNFPHPVSCKKFISCAKMENGKVLGWEYTCPKNLSFDPIGGMCNWSAGLGCNE